jgi:hypothetical protein
VGIEKPGEVGGGSARIEPCGEREHGRQNADHFRIFPSGNRKTKEGSRHPDRDGQFQHINRQVLALQADGQPVISVDTKKKELIGEYKNVGSDYRATGCPDKVKVHDFVDKELGKVAPYGIYDLATNAGRASVGIDHDTVAFAVNSIRRWYEVVGCVRYEKADRLLITADGGGSNGSRVRLWKFELQKLANETGLILQVVPLPARDVEVEQDRTSHVLPHYPNLAWKTARQSPRGRRAHCRHHNQNRPDGAQRTG